MASCHEDHVAFQAPTQSTRKPRAQMMFEDYEDWSRGNRLGDLFLGHDDGVWTVAAFPDGCWIVSGATDGSILVWEVATKKTRVRLIQEGRFERRLCAGEQNIRDDETFEAHTERLQSLTIAPNGTKFASTSLDNTTRFFDLTAFEPIGEPLKHPDAVYCVAFSDDNQLVATGCDDAPLRVWTVLHSDPDKESKQLQKDDGHRPRPSIPIEIIPIPCLWSHDQYVLTRESPHGFFDDNYPPRRSADGPHTTLSHKGQDLVNRLAFRRDLQQAQPEEERSRD
ncbi:WD40 repeat-like protein [Suillus decipiens]|nr:WD40 repeat-like protein [Suillus decipiens]